MRKWSTALLTQVLRLQEDVSAVSLRKPFVIGSDSLITLGLCLLPALAIVSTQLVLRTDLTLVQEERPSDCVSIRLCLYGYDHWTHLHHRMKLLSLQYLLCRMFLFYILWEWRAASVKDGPYWLFLRCHWYREDRKHHPRYWRPFCLLTEYHLHLFL